jgi:aspartyl-tRNA(Asn)/glutamyl-tRNA(Gln) amidotransferase subunit C
MSSSLDEEAVRHVAHLARLEITDEEVARYGEQLSQILRYMEHLNELDTTDIPPTAHALPVSNVFREDEVQTTSSLDPSRALKNAPDRQEDFFRVPKVLDQESA